MSSSPYTEPDFALGPLFVVGVVCLAAARRRPLRRIVGAALVVTEFTWPAYQRFKRRQHVPRLLAYNRRGDQAAGETPRDSSEPA